MDIQKIKSSLMKFLNDEDGLTIVEYAIAGGLVTLSAVAAFILLGENVAVKMDELAECAGATSGNTNGCGS